MMKCTTEQITDVTRGNTAALVGSTSSFEAWQALRRQLKMLTTQLTTKYSVYPAVAKSSVKSKDRRDSTRH